MSNSQPDELSQKLRAWKVEPQVPAGFQREVWQRIAARQSARAEAFWPSLLRWLSEHLSRPRYATATIAVALLAGVGAAHVQAQESNARNLKTLETRYAASVNPIEMKH